MERGLVHGGTGVVGGVGRVTENSMPEISFDWTAIATVVGAVATGVVAYYAYKAHKFALGYRARIYVSISLHPNDDIAEEENIGDESRNIVILVENDEDKPAKIKSVRYYFRGFMSASDEYKETIEDILSVKISDADGVVISSNGKHRYELNLAEVKKQAKGRMYFCVSVKHSLSPKPATASIQLPQ